MLRLWYVRLANAKHAAWDTSLFSTGISATNDGIVSESIYFIYIQIFLICKSATNDETLSVTK